MRNQKIYYLIFAIILVVLVTTTAFAIYFYIHKITNKPATSTSTPIALISESPSESPTPTPTAKSTIKATTKATPKATTTAAVTNGGEINNIKISTVPPLQCFPIFTYPKLYSPTSLEYNLPNWEDGQPLAIGRVITISVYAISGGTYTWSGGGDFTTPDQKSTDWHSDEPGIFTLSVSINSIDGAPYATCTKSTIITVIN
jgi:hypothetical protein